MPAAGCAPKGQTRCRHRRRSFFAIGEARIGPSDCVRPADGKGFWCVCVSLFGVLHRFTARGHWVKHACRLVTAVLHTLCVWGKVSVCVCQPARSLVCGTVCRCLCGFPGVVCFTCWGSACGCAFLPVGRPGMGCWHACRPLQLHLLCARLSLLFYSSSIHAAPLGTLCALPCNYLLSAQCLVGAPVPQAPTSLSLSLCQFCCCLNESRLRFFSLRCTASFVGLCTVDDPRCPHSVARANACHTHIVPGVHHASADVPMPGQVCCTLSAFFLFSYLGAGLVHPVGAQGAHLAAGVLHGVVKAVCQAASSSKHEPAQPTSALLGKQPFLQVLQGAAGLLSCCGRCAAVHGPCLGGAP